MKNLILIFCILGVGKMTFAQTYLPLTAGSGSPLTGTLYGTSINMSGGATLGNSLTGTSATFSGNITGANLNISNWNTAYSWGNHAAADYWSKNFIRAKSVGTGYDANTIDPDGGFTFSYSSTTWMSNDAFNEYGGIITFLGYTGGGAKSGKLQVQYGIGHTSESGSRLAFRTSYGNSYEQFRGWKEIWHSGNFNPDNYLSLSGGTLSGNITGTSAMFSGNVGIGTASPSEKLSVNGKIRSKEIKVEVTGWPDYVFEPDYKLPDLQETEQFIKENRRLPKIPSAAEVEINGINLGEMNAKLLQKVEELMLHLIEQDKINRAQQIKIEQQDTVMRYLSGQLNELTLDSKK